MYKSGVFSSAVVFAVTIFAASTWAQDGSSSTGNATAVRGFGGPDSVGTHLERESNAADDRYLFTAFDGFWQPWYDWKRERSENNDFKVGFSAWLLYQDASEVSGEEDDAAGGIYRLQGTWTLTGKDTPDHGGIEFRVEKRSAIGSGLSPSQLGGEISSAATNTAFLYTPNFRTDLAVFNYTQRFANASAGFAIGRLNFDAFLDPYAFQSVSKGFNNRVFIVNPTIGTTGIGALGAVLKGFVTDQVLLGVGVYDGNAVSGEFDTDTVEEGEFLKSAEISWSPSVDRYKTDRVQFTYWHKDARTAEGIESGQGWVLSATWKLKDKWMPFLRLGDSDGGAGTAAEKMISTGFEFAPREKEALSVGVGWAKPLPTSDGQRPRDEYVVEASYKFQFSRNFSITPDVQLLIHPAKIPDADKVWVVGTRGILSL
jgi:porin